MRLAASIIQYCVDDLKPGRSVYERVGNSLDAKPWENGGISNKDKPRCKTNSALLHRRRKHVAAKNKQGSHVRNHEHPRARLSIERSQRLSHSSVSKFASYF